MTGKSGICFHATLFSACLPTYCLAMSEHRSDCFGCYSKQTPIIAVDEPAKGLRIQGQMVQTPSFSDDFWSSSTFDGDNSLFQSKRSLSSISISNLNHTNWNGSASNDGEFVNHGLILWNESRVRWLNNGISEDKTKQNRGRALSWNASYESVLGRKTPFPRPVPLSEMIEFLVETWDREGMMTELHFKDGSHAVIPAHQP